MKYNDEFNNLGITNADGDERFNEDTFEMPSNDKNQPDIEVTNEGSEDFQVDEYLQEAGELDSTSEENFNAQENPQEQVNTSSSTSSSAASSASTAASTTAAATTAASVTASVVASVAVVATVSLGIITLPVIPTFDVELARATSSSLAFVLTTNVEELDSVRITLTGNDFEYETPYSSYLKFEELNPQETYYLSIYNEENIVYNASYFTNNQEVYDSCFIEVYEQSEEGFYFTFYDGLVEDETSRFHNIKVIANNGDVVFSDDTNEMEKEYFVNKNVDASILVYINGVVEGGASVTKYTSGGEPEIEYDYENIQWTWAEYGESCSVYIPAVNPNDDPLIAEASVEVTYRDEPQCEIDGYLTATATFVAPNGETYTDLYQCVLPATGHTYGEPVYTWDVDYYRCYAIRKCIYNEEHYEEEFAYSNYEVVTEPTTETEGLGRYTAVFENEAFETQTVEVTLPVVEETNMETFSDFTNCVSTGSMVGTGSATSDLGNTFEMNIYNTNSSEYTNGLELINVFDDEQSFISNKTPTEKPIKGIAITTDSGESNTFEVGVGLSTSEIDSSSTAQQISGYKQVISSTSYTWYAMWEGVHYFSVILGANESTGNISSITILYEDISYTIDNENNTIDYGIYPTTLVTDSAIIETLSGLGENYIDRSSGYYSYNGTFYDRVVIDQANSIELFDGTILENGQTYWFECTNIQWLILNVDDDGYYTLISTEVLDTVQFHTTEAMATMSVDAGVTSVYANNYYNSYVRWYLIETFGYRAFFNSNTTLLNDVEFDTTEAATYGIKSDGINTTMSDKIHLPTYNELYYLYNSSFGMRGRSALVTTYAIAKGANMDTTPQVQGTQKALGSYWLSTPGTDYQYNGAYIDGSGELYSKSVIETNVGIRPIIRIKL